MFLPNPLTAMLDQDGISPNNISKLSSRQVMRIGDYKLIHCQILQIKITRIVWQIVTLPLYEFVDTSLTYC